MNDSEISYFSVVRKDIIELIPPETKTLLEVGCGTGATIDKIKEKLPNIEIYAIEKNIIPFTFAGQKFQNVINADFETFDVKTLPQNYFDVIIFADVLEHFVEPWKALEKSKCLLSEKGFILASIPNIRNLKVLYKIIFDRFEYEESGLLDKTHLRFFTLHTIKKLFETENYKIERIIYNKTRGWKANLIRIMSLGLLSPFLIEQFIITARPK